MKTIIVLCAAVAVVLALPKDTYNTSYDNFNAKELADNPRILKNYGKCFLDQGPCTPEGLDFKNVISDALKSNCAKCTPKQRQLIREVVQAFKTKLPEIWKELVQKHDPNGEYTESFNKFLNGTD